MDNTWSVKESRIMPKTGLPLLSLSVTDRDHEVTTIAMNAKERLHTEALSWQMSVLLAGPSSSSLGIALLSSLRITPSSSQVQVAKPL